MNKRAIAILGAIFILIVGTLGFLIYQRSKSPHNNDNVTVVTENSNTDQTNTETQTPATKGKAVKASDDAVISPILFYSGAGISYFASSGQLFQTDMQISNGNVLLSNKRELPIALKGNMDKVLWPAVGNSFIAQFIDAGKVSISYYDSNRGSYVELPPKIRSIDWLPTGDRIAYVWVDNGKASLFTAKPDATGYSKLFDFFDPDNVIDVSPDGQNILFYRTQTTDTTNNKIVSVTGGGKVFKTIIGDGYNRGTLWSPDSKKFLFTKKDPSSLKYTLWVADIGTGEVRSLGLTTNEKKAVWSKDGQTVYVAVPTKGTAGEGLTEDVIYKINVVSLSKEDYQPGTAIDAWDMFLSTSEDILFFKNAQDNALYYISL